MSLTNTGKGLPRGTKRPSLENVDNPPTKKAKILDGNSKQESDRAKPSPKKCQSTQEKNKMEKSKLKKVGQEPKDSEVKANVVKPKTSESKDKPIAKDDKNPKELKMSEKVTNQKLQEGYVMNVNGALVEAHRGTPLRDVVNLPTTVLQGITEKQAKVLSEDFKVKTVRDLANWKFYQIAKSMKALAEVEERSGRQDTSLQNINDAVDKQFEKKLITTIMDQKIEVLQGVGKFLQVQMSKKLGITTMKELANYKPGKYAAALVALADYETAGFESKTTTNDSIPLSTFRPVVG